MTLNLSYLKKFVYIWYNICKTHGWCPHSALNCNNIANIYTALGMLKAVLVKKIHYLLDHFADPWNVDTRVVLL